MTELEHTLDAIDSLPAESGEAHFSAIAEIVDIVRPAIQQDGGDIALVSVADGIVRVRLTGTCTHCAMAGQTLGGIRRAILTKLGLNLRVLPVPIEDD